jgi:hypothetical protein
MCLSGNVETFTCRPDLMNGGACVWDPECPMLATCEPAQCGSTPAGTMCGSDTMAVFTCQPDANAGCSWHADCRMPGVCNVGECGTQPDGAVECMSGETGAWSCEPDTDRACRWVVPDGCSAPAP